MEKGLEGQIVGAREGQMEEKEWDKKSFEG